MCKTQSAVGAARGRLVELFAYHLKTGQRLARVVRVNRAGNGRHRVVVAAAADTVDVDVAIAGTCDRRIGRGGDKCVSEEECARLDLLNAVVVVVVVVVVCGAAAAAVATFSTARQTAVRRQHRRRRRRGGRFRVASARFSHRLVRARATVRVGVHRLLLVAAQL